MNSKNISASTIMIFLFLVMGINSCTVTTKANESVKDVMDRTVTRRYQTMNEQQLDSLNNDQALALFNEKDKEILATRYWMFDVNVPVIVSVMRSTKQKITVQSGKINFREKGTEAIQTVSAEKYRMEDRNLMNDRYINRFTAHLVNLKPGTTYEYQVAPATSWSDEYSFLTPGNDNSFSFIWTGDTHHSPSIEKLFNQANKSHPEAAFYSIAGDMVSEGLHRDHWDDLFHFTRKIISKKPLMTVLGNHDTRQGLGARMYRELFSYPKNAPAGVQPEHTYSFRYKNALFLMIESTAPIDTQKAWIEEQLSNTDATWKFAMFHFAPYNWEEPYPDIQAAWIPLFDKYHVDMVMNGHIHYYMRTKPMKAGKVVSSYRQGTVYVESVGIPTKSEKRPEEPYTVVRNFNGDLYQYVKIEGNKLSFSAINSDNKVIDSFTIVK